MAEVFIENLLHYLFV